MCNCERVNFFSQNCCEIKRLKMPFSLFLFHGRNTLQCVRDLTAELNYKTCFHSKVSMTFRISLASMTCPGLENNPFPSFPQLWEMLQSYVIHITTNTQTKRFHWTNTSVIQGSYATDKMH